MPNVLKFVVDGGYLLRKVRWLKGSTYGAICSRQSAIYSVGTAEAQ